MFTQKLTYIVKSSNGELILNISKLFLNYIVFRKKNLYIAFFLNIFYVFFTMVSKILFFYFINFWKNDSNTKKILLFTDKI